jgi:hypothetical protein
MYLSQPSWDSHPSGLLHTCSASLTKGSSRSGAVSQRQHGNGYEQRRFPTTVHLARPGPARPRSARLIHMPQLAPSQIGPRHSSRLPGPEPSAAGPSRSRRMSRPGLFGPAVCRLRSAGSGPWSCSSRPITPAAGSWARGLDARPHVVSASAARWPEGPAAQWRSSRPGSSLVVRLVAARPVVRLVARPVYHRSSPAAAEPLQARCASRLTRQSYQKRQSMDLVLSCLVGAYSAIL